MAFITKTDKSYTWPITISEPADGGQFIRHKVRVKFKSLSQSRIDEVINRTNEEDDDILTAFFIGWEEEDFKDELGANLVVNDCNKDMILSIPYVRAGIIKGFFESIAGKAFKRKN